MAKTSDILLGSLIADSLALGPHWIYDQEEIRNEMGKVTSLRSPLASYHPGKSAGDQTHYGDQTLVLLRSLAEAGNFNLLSFAASWQAFWEDPGTISYRDGATRATLANLQSGAAPSDAGSPSHDISGAARSGPLFLLGHHDEEEFLSIVRSQAAFTHPQSEVVESALFFAKVVLAVKQGASMKEALDATMSIGWSALPNEWLRKAEESAASAETDAAALESHGLDCHTDSAFPGICHLLLRHPEDPVTALIENASAGGDCAARGMILGMIHGARTPVSDWPAEWLSGLRCRIEALDLSEKIS